MEEAKWTRTVTTDKVTGLVTDNGTWVADKEKYAEVTSPVIEGYTADISVVAAETVTQENIVKDVNYTAKPVKPNKPGEDPNKPENPQKPGEDPNKPENPQKPGEDPNKLENLQKPQPAPFKPKYKLPNTGVASSNLVTTIAALGILSGVVLLRRKKNFK